MDNRINELRKLIRALRLSMLEAEAIHIIREAVAELELPVLLFSGGKDSIVMLRLAEKAFWPARIPFPVMHVDTGHNFDEVIEFRDRLVEQTGARLVVSHVQDDIDAGRVVDLAVHRADGVVVDELIDERAAANPAFVGMVEAAYERRRLLRALARRREELGLSQTQVAARMATGFRSWRQFDARRQTAASGHMRRILASDALSRDVFEIITRTLGD